MRHRTYPKKSGVVPRIRRRRPRALLGLKLTEPWHADDGKAEYPTKLPSLDVADAERSSTHTLEPGFPDPSPASSAKGVGGLLRSIWNWGSPDQCLGESIRAECVLEPALGTRGRAGTTFVAAGQTRFGFFRVTLLGATSRQIEGFRNSDVLAFEAELPRHKWRDEAGDFTVKFVIRHSGTYEFRLPRTNTFYYGTRIREVRRAIFKIEPCRACSGDGSKICKSCHGRGECRDCYSSGTRICPMCAGFGDGAATVRYGNETANCLSINESSNQTGRRSSTL